jgi:hypothetical protein
MGSAPKGRSQEVKFPAEPTPSRDPRPLARLLVDAVQGVREQPYPWDLFDDDQVVRSSLQHGVTPALAVMLRDRADVPRVLVDKLQRCYRDQLARHVRTLADLQRLAVLLGESGIRWAVVKGPALAETVWPRPDLRLYVDLDILVERQRLGEAMALLEAHGTTFVDRNWPFILERMQGELSMSLPFRTPLDLHWHLVNDPHMRRVLRFPIDEILERSSMTKLGRLAAPVMDPIDTVLHLAYHMVHSGGHRLVWLRDFDLALAAPGMDWNELSRRAARQGCSAALAVSLERTRQVLHPHRAFPRAASAGAWGRVASAADRLRPVPQLPGERRSGRIVFQSTRASTVASVLAAAQAALRMRGARTEREGPNPLHDDVADLTARARYLEILQGPREP